MPGLDGERRGPRPGQPRVREQAGQVTLAGLPAGAEARIEIRTADAQGPPKPESRHIDRAGHLQVDLPARSVGTILSNVK